MYWPSHDYIWITRIVAIDLRTQCSNAHAYWQSNFSSSTGTYLIVDAVLIALVLNKTFNAPLPGSSDDPESGNVETDEFLATTPSHEKSARHPDLHEAAVLYEKVMQGSMSADQVCQSGVIT